MKRTLQLAAGLIFLCMVAKPKSLPPSAFPELPTWIVAQLTQRECRIPQSHRRKRDNVIQGAFKQPGRTDWAVLCKTKTETKLLVFTQGEDPVGVEKVQNGLYADVSIQVASPLFMADYLQKSQVKPAALPKLDHDGLWYWLGPRNPDSHYFSDNASENVLLYFDGAAKWRRLITLILN